MQRKMNQEIFEAVCAELESTHEGLNTICKKHNSSGSAFYDFIDLDETGKRSELYTRAKDRQADYLADLILEVSFDDKDDEKPFVGGNHIQRDRLKMDALKFIAAKLKPRKYGDKIDMTSGGEKIEMPLFHDVIKKKE